MLLGAGAIQSLVDSGDLKIDPFEPDLLRPSSYLLRLDNRFRSWLIGEPVDPLGQEFINLTAVEERTSLLIKPGDFILGQTRQQIGLPKAVAGRLSTISHLGRMGVSVTLSSVEVRAGFGGRQPTALALEITTVNPSGVRLTAGMIVAHLALLNCAGDCQSSLHTQSIYEGLDPLDKPLYGREFPSPKATH